jgi:hypothetical protein
MIMFEVATLFLGWCNDWKRVRGDGAVAREGDAGLDSLVYLINDMLEERGFKGKFAALTVGVLDTATGALEVCTAGNNVLHVYSARAAAMVQQPLPQPPAAGVFPSDMVRMKSGFPSVQLSLEHGDAVFLFTDGFEEAKRAFRNHFGDEVACREPGVPEGGLHGTTHSRGQISEEFGISRITAIVNAVFARGTYVLERCHTVTRERLEFDFSSCGGTVEDAVLALVAIEKVFRLYRDARTGPSDRVEVDPRVDGYLRKHFRQFDRWFTTAAGDAKHGQPITYAGLKEDPQYDDLTLLVVRRP